MTCFAEVTRGRIKVELENIGEGRSGDYQPSDPEDVPLMRFSVCRKVAGNDRFLGQEWEQLDDASYCTQIPATSPQVMLHRLAQYLLDVVYEPANDGHSIKKICERLSWIEPEWLETKRTCYDCRHVLCWMEHGEHFLDCQLGQFPENDTPVPTYAEKCTAYVRKAVRREL